MNPFRIIGSLLILASVAVGGATIGNAAVPEDAQYAPRAALPARPAASLSQSTNAAQPPVPASQASDAAESPIDAFLAALRAQGAQAVRVPESVTQPGLTAQGQVIQVNGAPVWTFDYGEAASARAAAAQFNPDGSTKSAAGVVWAQPPTVWLYGQVLVVYTGGAENVIKPITAVAGKPVVGR